MDQQRRGKRHVIRCQGTGNEATQFASAAPPPGSATALGGLSPSPGCPPACPGADISAWLRTDSTEYKRLPCLFPVLLAVPVVYGRLAGPQACADGPAPSSHLPGPKMLQQHSCGSEL